MFEERDVFQIIAQHAFWLAFNNEMATKQNRHAMFLFPDAATISSSGDKIKGIAKRYIDRTCRGESDGYAE